MRQTRYLNGNYVTTLSVDGTKTYEALRVGEPLRADFPDSIDIKITNACSHGCKWCHESSISGGKSFDIDRTKDVLSQLPDIGIELAIGGGNILEIPHETLVEFLVWCFNYGFRSRITLNQKDLMNLENKGILTNILEYHMPGERYPSSLVGGVGVSIDDPDNFRCPDYLQDILSRARTLPIVCHIIAGIFPIDKLDDLVVNLRRLCIPTPKILILGYKSWGRGAKYDVPDMSDWSSKLASTLYKSRNGTIQNLALSFDNLAIEQLGIKDILLSTEWNNFFMGPEFSHSMYIDAVSEVFAPTSRDPERMHWTDLGILEYFKTNRAEHYADSDNN